MDPSVISAEEQDLETDGTGNTSIGESEDADKTVLMRQHRPSLLRTGTIGSGVTRPWSAVVCGGITCLAQTTKKLPSTVKPLGHVHPVDPCHQLLAN